MKSSRFWLGAALLLAAVVFAALTFRALYRGTAIDNQFRAQGSAEVVTKGTGRWYVWDNYKTVFDGQKVANPSTFPDDVHILIRDSDGQELDFHRDTDQAWQIGNHAKKSIGYVDATRSDRLAIEIEGGSGERILTFGQSDLRRELWRRLRGFAFAAMAFVAGVTMLIWAGSAERNSNSGDEHTLSSAGG